MSSRSVGGPARAGAARGMPGNGLLSGVRLRDLMILGILSAVFLSGSVIMIDGWSFLQYPLLGVGAVVVALQLLHARGLRRESWWSSVPLAVFLLSVILAALVNESPALVSLGLGLVLVWLLLVRAIPTVMEGRKLLGLIVGSALLSHLPLLAMPLVTGLQFPVRGIFYNPNSFGTVAATLYATVLAIFLMAIGRRTRSWPFVLALGGLMVTLFLATTASASRTSFLAVAGLTILVPAFMGSQVIEGTRIMLRPVRLLASGFAGLLILLLAAYLWLPVEEVVRAFIMTKFEIKAADPTDGRLDIWLQTISDATLFGNGREYFLQMTGVGAHNTFISILGQYGWPALFSYAALWIAILYRAMKYAAGSTDENLYRLVPLSVTLCFLALSMGEGMNGKLSMMMAFACVGAIGSPGGTNGRSTANDTAVDPDG